MDAIDTLIKNLEDMIAARLLMHDEHKYCNYKEVHKLEQDRYEPAKVALRAALREALAGLSAPNTAKDS